MSKVFIFAGNFEQARMCAEQRNLKYGEWTYLDRPEKLLGIEDPEVIYVGTYPERKDFVAIDTMINRNQKRSHGRIRTTRTKN